jgi:hypothetical protein
MNIKHLINPPKEQLIDVATEELFAIVVKQFSSTEGEVEGEAEAEELEEVPPLPLQAGLEAMSLFQRWAVQQPVGAYTELPTAFKLLRRIEREMQAESHKQNS